MGGFAAVAPVFKALAPVVGTLLSGGGSAPAPAPTPAAPAPAPAPVAPEPTVKEAAESPVIDTEAARVRAVKRRKAAESDRLFALSSEDDSAVILTKSLLGE
jgi:hypothetical protein